MPFRASPELGRLIREVRCERLVAACLDGRALVDPRLRDRGCDRCDGEPEGEPLDEPIPSPIAAHLPAPFLLIPADAHKTGAGERFFHEQGQVLATRRRKLLRAVVARLLGRKPLGRLRLPSSASYRGNELTEPSGSGARTLGRGASTPAATHPPFGMTAPLVLMGPYPYRTWENAPWLRCLRTSMPGRRLETRLGERGVTHDARTRAHEGAALPRGQASRSQGPLEDEQGAAEGCS